MASCASLGTNEAIHFTLMSLHFGQPTKNLAIINVFEIERKTDQCLNVTIGFRLMSIKNKDKIQITKM